MVAPCPFRMIFFFVSLGRVIYERVAKAMKLMMVFKMHKQQEKRSRR